MGLTLVPPRATRLDADPHPSRWTPSVFESSDTPADAALVERLEQSVRGMDLAAPPVVLPDFHHKRNVEMPSSIAIATRDTIRPTLTSAAVNCGMALMAFDTDQPSERAIIEFFSLVRERLPDPPGNRRDLTSREVVRCALDGARFAADRFDINRADLDRIEEGGRLDLEAYGGIDRARRQLPWLLMQLSRFRFGNIGPSNHFIELQRVEEIYRARHRREIGDHRGAADAAVPRWRRDPHGCGRAALRAPDRLPAEAPGDHGSAETPLSPGLGGFGGGAADPARPLLSRRVSSSAAPRA